MHIASFTYHVDVHVHDYVRTSQFLSYMYQINEEEGPVMHSIIQNHFQSIRVLKGEKKLKYGHHQAILAISR